MAKLNPSASTRRPHSNFGDTDTVRRIVAELERLDPARARYLAAFAYVLSRMASADLDISSAETGKMVEIVPSTSRPEWRTPTSAPSFASR